MAEKFVIGDVVKVAVLDDSPAMTVDMIKEVEGNFSVSCIWFGGKEIKQGHFKLENLSLVGRQKTADLVVNDKVQLKSGGPDMVVTDIDQVGVSCLWFDDDNNKTIRFPPAVLGKREPIKINVNID